MMINQITELPIPINPPWIKDNNTPEIKPRITPMITPVLDCVIIKAKDKTKKNIKKFDI